MQKEKVIILGSGPAGWSAAIYTSRANLNPLLISGNELGGQVSITYEVENYPGFPQGTTGPELVDSMRQQAEKFGARLEINEVIEVDFTKGSPFYMKTHSQEYEADAVIVATGASPVRLGVSGESDFIGRGVSFCATCDGFFFRGKDVVVVGGGDSALEEGLFLTKYASAVRVIHRRDMLRAGAALQRRALTNDKMSFVWDTAVERINGNGKVQAVEVRNLKSGAVETLPTDGVFIYVGHHPNSSLFEGQLAMDEHRYLITDKKMTTSVPGVFAAGEIQDPLYRQVATSVGQGSAAGIMAERWLSERASR
ncbi:MAG: thioredoxin-disulfide reductase [Chloroflexi bacterium]|nr:thioredoxin-disulfide reductase [Chloroflexota bacterium]